MRAFDGSQLIVERRHCFAVRGGDRDNLPARSVLAQPPYIDLARYHLLRRSDIDVAQGGCSDRFVCRRTLAFCWTFDRDDRPLLTQRVKDHRAWPPFNIVRAGKQTYVCLIPLKSAGQSVESRPIPAIQS